MVIRLISLALTLVYAALALTWPSAAAEQEKPRSGKVAITLTLKISDKPSGLTLEAKKLIPSGSNAFDVLRDIVKVKYKTFPKLGPLVTSLCGIDAPDGGFWALSIDGKYSHDGGIASITLDKDTCVEWTTKPPPEKPRR
jgi:hypothetical protein